MARKTQRTRRAQRLVQYHLDTGRMIRPDRCQNCGRNNQQIEAAHYDYDYPLVVKWLCTSCHRRWDKREPKDGMGKEAVTYGKAY